MKNKASSSLRQRAEAFLDKHPEAVREITSVDVKKLVEDLHIHQIELEIQNEELRRAQQELEASRDRYSDLYDFSPVGYVTVSNKGLVLQANLSCATMLGVERSSFIGQPFSRFVNKDDLDAFYLHAKKLIDTKTKQAVELRLVKKDRSQFHAQLESIVKEDPVENATQIRIAVTDITERKLAQKALQKAHDELEQKVKERTAELTKSHEELKRNMEISMLAEKRSRESEERYALAVAGSTDGIWDWDILSNTVFYSDRFKEILGYDVEEFPGTVDAFRSRLHPEDADAVWQAVERHLQDRIPYNIQYRIKTKSGEYRWFLARGQAIWDDKGNPTRMSGSLQDINEYVEAVQRLRDALIEIKELKERLEAEKVYLQEEIKSEYNYENIIGNSDVLRYTLYKVEQIAPTDTAVIIFGETGTGKELIARAIHGAGPRKNRAFVKVNCATLPSNLMESELFGHERGAFSGAFARRLGRFEVADGATLFLDEIGELPLELQTKLLRVIQDGEFERVGSSHTIKTDVRIIAATNRNLEEDVRTGRFREDLWFRLNIFPITVPPLRDRMDDLPMLVEFFVDKVSKKHGKFIDYVPKRIMNSLKNYHWPGNVRELENVIERAVINASENKLRLMDNLTKPQKDLMATPKTLAKVERDHIVRILEETRWKVSGKNGASEILGLNPSTLRGRMRKLGIRKP